MQNLVSAAHYSVIVHKQQTVGTSSAPLTPLSTPTDPMKMPEQIFVQALSTNTASIFIGDSTVAAGGAGLELPPGANLSLPSNIPSRWHVISASAAQKLNITYLGGII